MSAAPEPHPAAVRGRLDVDGRLVEADPMLADIHRRAGGREGGALALPQVAAIARLARRLGTVVSRGAIAADGSRDLDLWVRAEPVEGGTLLSIGGWTERPPHAPARADSAEREIDYARAAADWVWETDESLRLTQLSPPASAALGRPASEWIGQPLTGLFRFREDDDGALPILQALAERRSFEDQLAELRAGSRESYRLNGVPLIDGAGGFAGFRGSALGLSEALHAQAANDEDPPASLADFPAFGERLDKALRDPLDHIIRDAETIGAQDEGPLQPDYAGYAADIATAGRHLLSLVDDLVDLQAVERPDFAPAADPIDLAAVARQAAGLLAGRAAERRVVIEAPAEGAVLPAVGEHRRALQIVVNLLANSVRYSPEGEAVRLLAEQRGGLASVRVVDRGKGIDPADQARIFDKFGRVDPLEPGGTGLGLYIARRLARAMGGDLVCESAPGEGAAFTFTLPLERPR